MKVLPVRGENIPSELKEKGRWVLWRAKKREAGWAKAPLMPNGRPASVSDRRCWSSFDEVWLAYTDGRYDGIGFCLAGDGLVFVDYDAADAPLTVQDLGSLAVRGWTERSPSGKGLHTVVIARKANSACRYTPNNPKVKAVEIYDDRRYFTVTGHTDGSCVDLWKNQVDINRLFEHMPKKVIGKPFTGNALLSDDEVLESMMASRQWLKISPHWFGEGVTDHSSADLSLLNHLAYWTNNDPIAMERLFGASALGQRDKWRKRADYRSMTIEKALLGLPV